MKKNRKWFRIRFSVLIAILLGLIYIDYRFDLIGYNMPMGQGSAGPDVPKDAFEGIWSEDEHVLIGLGDSITTGFGTAPNLNYFAMLKNNDNEQYPEMAGCDLTSVILNLSAKNISRNYTISQEHVEDQLPLVPDYPPDVKGIVVITSGGNDLIHDYGRRAPKDGAMYGCTYEQSIEWTENTKGRIRQVLEGVSAKFPGGCEIFLANIYDPTDGIGNPRVFGLPKWKDCVQVLGLMNTKIAELCDEFDNVHLVDIHSEFLGHGAHCREFWRKNYHSDDPTYWFCENIEDPSTRGYDAIRRVFLLEMIEVLKD